MYFILLYRLESSNTYLKLIVRLYPVLSYGYCAKFKYFINWIKTFISFHITFAGSYSSAVIPNVHKVLPQFKKPTFYNNASISSYMISRGTYYWIDLQYAIPT